MERTFCLNSYLSMKTLVVFVLLVVLTTMLTACSTTSPEYDALNDCIDAMVEAEDSEACDLATRSNAPVDFALDYINVFDDPDPDVTYLSPGIPEDQHYQHAMRYIPTFEDWPEFVRFQIRYTMDSSTDLATDYDTIADVSQTMATDIRSMNDILFQTNYEFYLDDTFSWSLLDNQGKFVISLDINDESDMLSAYPNNEQYLTFLLDDDFYDSVWFFLGTSDIGVILRFDNEAMTYTQQIDYMNPDVVTDTTFADVGALIDTTLEGLGYTLVED